MRFITTARRAVTSKYAECWSATCTGMRGAALADFSRRMQGLEERLKTLTVALPLLLLVAVAWPFVLFTAMTERRPRWSPAKSEGGATATTSPAATQPVVVVVTPGPA